MKWWSRRVTLPHEPACRAGALLVCHDPRASRLGAAPSKLSFGDSAAPAGARLVGKWMVRLPGIAPGWRSDTSVAGSHSAVKSQPRKLKGPGAFVHAPGPCHFNKEQTPLGDLAIPTRGFTAVVSVFRGTPPAKPFDCKSGLTHPACLVATGGQTPPAENLGSPTPFYVLCQVTSSRCRLRFVLTVLCLSLSFVSVSVLHG